jgi:hypothetical protein
MSVYTVHEPPLKGDDAEPNPERFVFVRDGFAFWAFLLTPLWMLRHRLWLVLLLYILLTVALQIGLELAGASSFARSGVSLLLSLLVGFEAATLRRWTLQRRRWRQIGVVVGDDFEAAERRFFDAWARDLVASPRVPQAPVSLGATSIRMAPQGSDVLGLFPQPGPSR